MSFSLPSRTRRMCLRRAAGVGRLPRCPRHVMNAPEHTPAAPVRPSWWPEKGARRHLWALDLRCGTVAPFVRGGDVGACERQCQGQAIVAVRSVTPNPFSEFWSTSRHAPTVTGSVWSTFVDGPCLASVTFPVPDVSSNRSTSYSNG